MLKQICIGTIIREPTISYSITMYRRWMHICARDFSSKFALEYIVYRCGALLCTAHTHTVTVVAKSRKSASHQKKPHTHSLVSAGSVVVLTREPLTVKVIRTPHTTHTHRWRVFVCGVRTDCWCVRAYSTVLFFVWCQTVAVSFEQVWWVSRSVHTCAS